MRRLTSFPRHRTPSQRSAALWRCLPRLEELEARLVPSTIIVTSTADSGPGSLRAALAAANNGDAIVFALPNPSTIQLTSGTLTVSTSVTISGPGPSSLTVKGNNSFDVFDLAAGASLSGMTITGGNGAGGRGGGIDAEAPVVLTNCVVSGNTSKSGGGIYSRVSLIMNHCVVSNNSGAFAGGLENDGTGTARISDSDFTGNGVVSNGGGILNYGVMVLNRTTISANLVSGAYPAFGGGIDQSVATSAALTLLDCTVSYNSAQGGTGLNAEGGGIDIQTGTLTLLSSTIDDNSASGGDNPTGTPGNGSGGGIFCLLNATVTMSNTTIADNIADSGRSDVANGFGTGAGLFDNGSVMMTNCTVAGNNASDIAGGIYIVGGPALVLNNSIVARNGAAPGGGQDIEFGGGNMEASYDLVGSAEGNGLVNGTNGDLVGANPLLGPLANNGGPTRTTMLLAGSPAIDAGSNSLAAGGTDQRGLPRIAGLAVDMGAVEFQPEHLIAVGAGYGMPPEVKVYDAATGQLKLDFLAYGSTFTAGVRVAVADVNGDGIPDIITAPAGVKVSLINVNGALVPSFDLSAGRAPEIKVFSGADGSLLDDFLAYDPSFKAGVFVTAADISGSPGHADIIVAPDATGQSGHTNVRVFFNSHLVKTGASLAPDREFNAYAPGFGGGVRIAVGDINGDGHPDIITAPGIWSGPDVRIFNGQAIAAGTAPGMIGEFLAYAAGYFGGVFVASGDVNGDGRADVVTGTNGNGGPEVKAFDGFTIGLGTPPPRVLDDFFAYSPLFNGGATVAVVDVNGDGIADIVTGAGPGGGPHVRAFNGLTSQPLTGAQDSFYAFDPSFSGGVFVGGA